MHAAQPPQRFTRPPSSGHPADARRTLGRLGEELAASHLIGLGYSVLARNVRTRHGEIDLIVFDGAVLVFAEVKTRRVHPAPMRPRTDENPLLLLRHRQRARLRRLAAAWLGDESRIRPRARMIRFDAVGVTVDRRDRLQRIDHVEGAW